MILPRNVVTTQTRRATKQNIAKPELQRGETRHSRYDNEYVYGLSSNRRYETVQNQNNHSPHIFHSMHNPRIPWSCVTGLGAPTLQKEATLIMCNIGILQITRIHFTRNLLSASPVLQVRYNAAPILSEVYTKLYRLRLRVH
jgi:hypothetical protein